MKDEYSKPEPTLDYPAAARAIALWLTEYCDESLPYPDMVADAARKAARHIEALKKKLSQIDSIIHD